MNAMEEFEAALKDLEKAAGNYQMRTRTILVGDPKLIGYYKRLEEARNKVIDLFKSQAEGSKPFLEIPPLSLELYELPAQVLGELKRCNITTDADLEPYTETELVNRASIGPEGINAMRAAGLTFRKEE